MTFFMSLFTGVAALLRLASFAGRGTIPEEYLRLRRADIRL